MTPYTGRELDGVVHATFLRGEPTDGQALPNREVARALVLSERTVDSHVHSILGQPGLKSRTEITRWWSATKATVTLDCDSRRPARGTFGHLVAGLAVISATNHDACASALSAAATNPGCSMKSCHMPGHLV